MTRKTYLPLAVLVAGLALSGCSDFNQALGLSKSSPDEFQVVVRPPLTLPPSFSLNPVDESATSGVSTSSVSVTEEVLAGAERTAASGFDTLFGVDQIEPDIRTKIDEETLGIQLEKRIAVQVLFGGKPNVGPTLAPAAEARRIRDAQQQGRDLTETPTPAIDPVENQPVEVD